MLNDSTNLSDDSSDNSDQKKIPCVNVGEKRVGLFVTCLVNTMRPSVGFASLSLLEQAGCKVEVPEAQSCCGQPAFNSGDDEGTRQIAYQTIAQFEGFDYVVVPSGSCAAMIKKSFIEVLKEQPEWLARAKRLANVTYELLSFLVDVCDFVPEGVELNGSYTYHDSCSGYRSLGVYEQPRKMLAKVSGLSHKPLNGHSECCGFGGTFCVKYSDISNEIVTEKADNILDSNVDFLLGGDMGCLMNMAGKLNRDGHTEIKALHTAEVLAGMTQGVIEVKNAGK
ncbi:(Fe-S)-binding protein [Glaciecola sp. KUL10]|uniref:(Fe-S)-binding protein n=1 Tax=Glaciecola sp. (strain KUL10) TaxID=2161813 RepID=UPI000D78974D|nr:(Fe-S)-binding protein [Glaciecola sp. KUL10]GBL05367.1 glycolate oxidase-like protein [Glaciecola sp. KUL10]